MIYPSADVLDEQQSKYALVIVAAKRSRQIKDGARTLVRTASANPLTVALEEIASGEITSVLVGEPERTPRAVEPVAAFTGLVEGGPDDLDPTAADISRLLADGVDLHTFEPDSELREDVVQTQEDVMEAEVNDAAEGAPYGIPVPDPDTGAGDDATAQHLEDIAIDDAEPDEE